MRSLPDIALRDWFAGQALAGMAGADSDFMDGVCKRAKERGVAEEQWCAMMAYALADAMLAERCKS